MGLREKIQANEGLRLTVYDDATGKPIVPGYTLVGHPTIGYGTNLEAGILEIEAEFLFEGRLSDAIQDVGEIFDGLTGLSGARFEALVDMRFQLGPGGFRGFKKMIEAAKEGKWEVAYLECMGSKYALQCPKRARENAETLKNG